ncbi:MAG: AAA family ATPase [Candidatus Competibacteraceae bacterium]|nr:AAA family ATPase [Candidatus Competibacteraceae bacterium]
MWITRLKLKNWRNFKQIDIALWDRVYLIGPNASGKSNLLDVFRFLRDIAKTSGGGLQKAVKDRHGITKLRCLQARTDPEVAIEVALAESLDSAAPKWTYAIGFKSEGKGPQRLLLNYERVSHQGQIVLNRPDADDQADPARLTQTHLEQINANAGFRPIAEFFASVTYLHLVPQLLKYGDAIGGKRLDDDPFGQGFLERIARCTPRTRDARLKRIQTALQVAVPQFKELRFVKDEVNGHPHLEAFYEHWRPSAGWQREEQFSDGTLRLLALLWSLLDGDSLLLLEEPELSLNEALVEKIPLLLDRLQRQARHQRQILLSTHSEALLRNPGIDGRGILRLEPEKEGTRIVEPDEAEQRMMETGLSAAEVLLPKARPARLDQWALFK